MEHKRRRNSRNEQRRLLRKQKNNHGQWVEAPQVDEDMRWDMNEDGDWDINDEAHWGIGVAPQPAEEEQWEEPLPLDDGSDWNLDEAPDYAFDADADADTYADADAAQAAYGDDDADFLEDVGAAVSAGVAPRKRHVPNPKKQKKNRKYLAWGIGIASAIVAVLIIVSLVKVFSDVTNVATKQEDPQPEAMVPKIVEVTFKATGDNLIHNTIYQQAAARANNEGYDFSYCYEEIKPIIEGTDLVFVNQETPLATAIYEPSNYPLFNTPSETVLDLKDVGFNLFNLASNHALDKGAEGMEATLDFMDSVDGITHFGSYRNMEDENTPRVLEKNGITFAFVSVTEMTNGMTLPADTELDLVYTEETEQIQSMLAAANEAADVVILSAHWGDENTLQASERQKAWAADYAEWGADIIIGHHPHVLQEIETITTSDGRNVPVVYSLGNFISAMGNVNNHIGGFYGCTFQKNMTTGEITIADQSFTPIVNYFSWNYSDMRVIPFAKYTEELAATHGLGMTIAHVEELLLDTIGPDLLTGMPDGWTPPTEEGNDAEIENTNNNRNTNKNNNNNNNNNNYIPKNNAGNASDEGGSGGSGSDNNTGNASDEGGSGSDNNTGNASDEGGSGSDNNAGNEPGNDNGDSDYSF